MFGSNAVASENTTYDILLSEAGTVDASGALGIGVVSVPDDAGCTLIKINGLKYNPALTKLYHPTSGYGVQWSISSAGDIYESWDTTGAGAYTAKIVTKNDGMRYPVTDASIDVGRSANRYRYGYFSGGVLTTSDERMKDLSDLTDTLKAIGLELKPLISQYVFKNSQDTDIHIGISAQKVCDVFSSHGLNAINFGIVDHVSWGDEFDDDGYVVLEAGDRYSVNYSELSMLIMAILS